MTSLERMPVALRIAQVLGLTSSAFVAGSIWSISYLTIPPLHLSPAPILARQWNELYERGKSVAPFLTLAAALSFSALANDAGRTPIRHAPHAFELYTLAAVLVPSIVPFTLLFMKDTNDQLLTKACDSKFGEEANVRKLICDWRWWNFGRGALCLVGAVAGAAGVVGF